MSGLVGFGDKACRDVKQSHNRSNLVHYAVLDLELTTYGLGNTVCAKGQQKSFVVNQQRAIT